MPLIPFADFDSAPEEVREAFEKLPRKLNIFRMWANAPSMFKPGLRLGGAILGKQKLDSRLRELVILLVAKLEGGEYEWVQHVPIGLGVGCRQDQIDALAKADLKSAFDAREQSLLKFSKEVIENVRASEETFKDAAKHFSAQEIVEIIFTCGFYMTMARLTETTRVEIDEPGGMPVLDTLVKMR